MMWQMWIAFGIMLGFVVSVAFQNVRYDEKQPWNSLLELESYSQKYFNPAIVRVYDGVLGG